MTTLLACALLVATAGPGSTLAADTARTSLPAAAGGFRQVGYYTSWAAAERNFPVKDVDTSGAAARLTHLDYAFGNVSTEGRCIVGDPEADYQTPVPAAKSVDGVADATGARLAGNFHQLLKLKQKHPHLKVLISLGGWTWSKNFSDAVLTPTSRAAFVSSCIDLFIRGNLPDTGKGTPGGPGAAAGLFDGIDLDWEWPGSQGEEGNVVRAVDRENFTKVVAEFRRQLDSQRPSGAPKPLLTAFLSANPDTIDAGYQVKPLFRDLDFATVQGYDFHGTWESTTNQQSALRLPPGSPEPDYSVESTVQAYTGRGAPRNKIVVGVPYYGHGWTGVTGGGDGMHQPATGAAPGLFEDGTEDYKTLKKLPEKGFTLHRDRQSGQAWLFDGTTFWTFDDATVVRQKARYIREQKLGGTMAWSLDGDDSHATLTRTIAAVLKTQTVSPH